MIIDFDSVGSLPSTGQYDVCIAGGGVAGIVLAMKLAERGKKILLLEAGGLEASEESQSLYSGANIGRDYFDLDIARLRYLGGSSNHWSGRCAPLDAQDFQAHSHIEASGWPIDIGDVEPYLPGAREILELGEFPPDTPVGGPDARLKNTYGRWPKPPVRFGQKYHDYLQKSDTIDVLLHANLVDIKLDPASGRVAAFLFRGYKEAAVPDEAIADHYVLALGGIENARMLLNARQQMPTGIGNGNGLVGRYFMEHLDRDVGYYVLDTDDPRFTDTLWALAPTAEMIRKEEIANVRVEFHNGVDPGEQPLLSRAKETLRNNLCKSEILTDFVRTITTMRCLPHVSDLPNDAGRLVVSLEQVPNPNSRVTLLEEVDRFGLRRVALDWRLSSLDWKTVNRVSLEVAKYMAQQDFGRIKLYDWVLDDTDPGFPEPPLEGGKGAGYHHMGTTRMGLTKKNGVVDRNCQVFDVDNLYIAGSSVFPTGGHANPTLTIVQLTLRLADHMAQS